MKYKQSQFGWVIILLFILLVVFLCLAYALQWGNNPLTFTPFLVLSSVVVVLGFMLYKLTVEVRGSTLRLAYGIGLINFKFEIDQLEELEIIRVPWYYGIGIRITPKGMLYSIHGWKALQLKYKSKGKSKSLMVGTSEPEQLKRALESNCNQ
ncbi:hypothetical protein GCM10027284_30280 [Cyclobacterium sediminis]